jgi:hypothetical protein
VDGGMVARQDKTAPFSTAPPPVLGHNTGWRSAGRVTLHWRLCRDYTPTSLHLILQTKKHGLFWEYCIDAAS